MKKYQLKLWVIMTCICAVILSFAPTSISTSGYMKITLKNDNVFYGKIANEEDNKFLIDLDSIFISLKKNEIKSMIPVDTLPYTSEGKANTVVVSKSGYTKESMEEFIEALGIRYRIDPALIKAVIKVESNFDRFAISRKGAKGLMQLMPETAQHFGVFDLYNPYQNVEAGVKFLNIQIGDFDDDIKMALAAYNAGPEAVKRYNSVPPFPETKRFIAKVLNYYYHYKRGKSIMEPRKIIYTFWDKKGNYVITDIPPTQEIYVQE
ncbi:MAG: lytic transglycosylase domain-containing protein [bacterium]